jgi:hypothetical protein
MLKKYFLLTLLASLGAATNLTAQSFESFLTDSVSTLVHGKYFKLATAVNFGRLRDRGNSALDYTGVFTSTAASWYISKPKSDFELTFGGSTGQLVAKTKSGTYMQSYNAVALSAYKLYSVYTARDLQIKLGGGISSQILTRMNPELFNTYMTVENFSSLDVIGQLDYYFLARARSGKALGIFNYKRPDRIYKLSYRLTASALPVSFRPGYAYVDNIVVSNPDYLSDHQLRVGGYNISSEISLTRYLRNKNAIAFTYRWNALMATQNQFEMATHSLGFSFFFNYK